MKRTLALLAGAGAVLALVASISLYGIADLPFYTKGEPREALVVWELAHGGGRILPLRNGDEIPSKPPFFHWLGAVAASALGEVDEFATRLPSATLAIVMVLAVYFFAASASRIRSGWLSAIALATSFEWLRAARTARVDMTFSVLFAGALLLFARILQDGPTPTRRFAFWALLAAATLTKGPIGLVLPLVVIVVFATMGSASNVRTTLRELRTDIGLPAVLLVTGAWYGAAFAIGGEPFLETHVLRENVFRVLDAERFGSGHSHGPFYLFGQFFLGAFPWSLSLPAVAWWLWEQRPLDETRRFLVTWFVVVFAFFLIPDSKRGVYLLPAYPPGALLFGLVLGPGPEGARPRALAAAGWLAGCAVLAVLGLAGLVIASGLPIDDLILPRLRPHEATEVAAALATLRANLVQTIAASLLALLCGLAAAANAPGAHWLRASVPLVVGLVVALGGLVAPVERTIAATRTLESFLPRVNARVGDEALAFEPGSFDYGAVFYAQRPIPVAAKGETAGRYTLGFEGSAELAGREVVLRSEGTGARGRAPLLLLR